MLIFAGTLMSAVAVVFSATLGVFSRAGFLSIGFGLCGALGASPSPHRLRHVHTFLLTGRGWLTAAAVGAVPLLFCGMPLTGAFFESMSGITTTGLHGPHRA